MKEITLSETREKKLKRRKTRKADRVSLKDPKISRKWCRMSMESGI